MKHMRLSILATVALCACATPQSGQNASYAFEAVPWSAGDSWFKGNTHAHTTESDGDSPPEYVARWYKDHGYDFLVLSDHNVFTDPARLSGLADSTFLLVPGEEVTSSFDGAPVHVNGLNLPGVVEARTAESLVGPIQANVDAIREVAGVPHINHPNFGWAFSADELAQVENDRLIEIWNGHPTVHNNGGDREYARRFASLDQLTELIQDAKQPHSSGEVDEASVNKIVEQLGRVCPPSQNYAAQNKLNPLKELLKKNGFEKSSAIDVDIRNAINHGNTFIKDHDVIFKYHIRSEIIKKQFYGMKDNLLPDSH